MVIGITVVTADFRSIFTEEPSLSDDSDLVQ